MSRSDRRSWHEFECWIAFALGAGIVLVVGRQVGALVNWDGLSALAHAHDVLYRDGSINIALLGFVEPPAPVLCYLPVVGVARVLGDIEFGTAIFGALFMGTAALLTARLLVRSKIPLYVRIVLIAALVTHPLTLSYAALGSPAILLLVALLGMMKSLMSWGDEENLRDLIGCSLYAALAVLTRYEMLFIVIAAAGYIAVKSWRKPHPWQRLEGTLITFVLPVAYFSALWIGANAVIMGDAWYFLKRTFGGPDVFSGNMFFAVIMLPLMAFPFIYALAYHEARPSRPGYGAASVSVLIVTGIITPVLMPDAFASLGSGQIWPALAGLTTMTVAGGIILTAAFFSHYTPGRDEHTEALSGTLVVAIISVVLLGGSRMAGFIYPPTTYTAALQGDVAFGQDAYAERHVGEAVAEYLSKPEATDNRTVIAGWPGFAAAFFAEQNISERLVAITVYPESRIHEDAVQHLGEGDLLIILEGREAWQYALSPLRLQRISGDFGSWSVFRLR